MNTTALKHCLHSLSLRVQYDYVLSNGALSMMGQKKAVFDDLVLAALDFETTGLDYAKDSIIEVGAVKFKGDQVLDQLSLTVNPQRRVDPFVIALTGIKQAELDVSPTWDAVKGEVGEFLGDHPIVAHNAEFERSFMRAMELSVKRPYYDTLHLAATAMEDAEGYSLEYLAQRFGLGHDSPHRALSDADATRQLFVLLVQTLAKKEDTFLAALQDLGRGRDWVPAVVAERVLNPNKPALPMRLNRKDLRQRIWVERRQKPTPQPELLTKLVTTTSSFFGAAGELSKVLKDHSERPDQTRMAELVADAFVAGKGIVIEAGTGVGKSLAYLVPALLYARATGKRVVVSTHTLNLQEQLLGNDWDLARKGIKLLDPQSEPHVAQLKGRSNYLCLRRLREGLETPPVNQRELSLLAKCLRWVQSTVGGERSEIKLGRWLGYTFTRYSAEDEQKFCPPRSEPCFFGRARRMAENADLVIINHSLLLADLELGNKVPEYDALIIDEAHHLRDVATSHLTFAWSQRDLENSLTPLGSSNGAVTQTVAKLNRLESGQSGEPTKVAQRSLDSLKAVGGQQKLFFTALNAYREIRDALRLTESTRQGNDWEALQKEWGVLKKALDGLVKHLTELGELADAKQIEVEFGNELRQLTTFGGDIQLMLNQPSSNFVYWISARGKYVTLNGAPLHVSHFLGEKLFNGKKPAILVGATLSHNGGFSRLRRELGIKATDTEILPSGFNYQQAALTVCPRDIPEPNQPGYGDAIAQAIQSVAKATGGRSLALFTSRASLENVRRIVTKPLGDAGIKVVAQEGSGSARQVMESLAGVEHGLALGLKSMWEGVDMERAPLLAVVVAKLPFPVPADPVHAARAELTGNGFGDYFVPEAVRTFRQAFGRLIRSTKDRGVFVVLDSRYVNRRYGMEFKAGLPDCRQLQVELRNLGETVSLWLKRPR